MRKTFAFTLGAALAGGLAWAAFSAGAADRTSFSTLSGADGASARLGLPTETYKGKFKQSGPGTKIKIKAYADGGEPVAIKSMRYRNLPADCPVSKSDRISGGWTFEGVTVNGRRKFKAKGSDGLPNPSSLKFKGRFSEDFDKVKGTFQTVAYFPATKTLPEETCGTEITPYRAKR